MTAEQSCVKFIIWPHTIYTEFNFDIQWDFMSTDNELVMDAGGSGNFCFEILHAKAFYF